MDTQNTSFHLRLLHKEIWMLAFANLLVSVGVYMLIPETFMYMRRCGFSDAEQSVVMVVYSLGIFAFGPFVNYLVERFPRKRICLLALMLLMADIVTMSYFRTTPFAGSFWGVVLFRFVLGTSFGLAQMVLLSTLVVDAVQSYFRTEANHHVNWFGRFAVALGPLVALYAVPYGGAEWAFTLPSLLILLGFLLICLVKFPFKTPPDGVPVCSLDRFFLPRSAWLFAILLLVTLVTGMLFTLSLSTGFYTWMAFGFFMAAVSEHFVFANAELMSQAVTGLISISASLILMATHPQLVDIEPMAASLFGIGLGLFGSRFLLFFIKLSSHCQRGTSQSTFFLGWESGIGCGLAVGQVCFHGNTCTTAVCALAVIACVACLYIGYVHRWYMLHKNR